MNTSRGYHLGFAVAEGVIAAWWLYAAASGRTLRFGPTLLGLGGLYAGYWALTHWGHYKQLQGTVDWESLTPEQRSLTA
jgi:hypothetical protein